MSDGGGCRIDAIDWSDDFSHKDRDESGGEENRVKRMVLSSYVTIYHI